LLQVIPDVDIIVTDSPLILSAIYADPQDNMQEALFNYEFKRFNNLIVYLNRVKPYSSVGRHQTAEESDIVGIQIKEYLDSRGYMYYNIDGDEDAPRKILELIKSLT
jgi:hypothetical protein